MGRRDLDDLTDREREVLTLLRRDFTNEQIAARLGISLDGAKYHVSQILSKLGVATREEAAAVVLAPRRRWWAALPLAAKAAGAAVVVAALAGIGLLAWGVLRTSGEGDGPQAEQPSATATAAAQETQVPAMVVGQFADPYDFQAFALQLSQAIETGDTEWIVEHTRREHDCATLTLMSLPEECASAMPGATAEGILIGFLNSDEAGLNPADDYAGLIRTLLTNAEPTRVDQYGDGAPRLYAFGLVAADPGGGRIEAAMTSITSAPPFPIRFSEPQRLLGLLHAVYEAPSWVIDAVSFGGSPDDLALFLDATGAGTRVDTIHPFWHFWRRWEQPSPTP